MSDIKTAPPSAVPSLTDFAARINTEFAAIQKAEQDANRLAQRKAKEDMRAFHASRFCASSRRERSAIVPARSRAPTRLCARRTGPRLPN
jgi:hypothetical protein